MHDILGVTYANQLDETHPPVAATAQSTLLDKPLVHQIFDHTQGLQLGRCCTCMPSGFERFTAEVKAELNLNVHLPKRVGQAVLPCLSS